MMYIFTKEERHKLHRLRCKRRPRRVAEMVRALRRTYAGIHQQTEAR